MNSPAQSSTRQNVAILGGGLSSLVTALELTSGSNAGKYNVTIYQIGWRLGGKGASGRNITEHNRIEEHGLHMWMGFYENSFRLIRAVFQEWKIPSAHPWETGDPATRWRKAFTPQSYAPLAEYSDGKWDLWDLDLSESPGTPGDGVNPVEDLWSLLHKIAKRMLSIARDRSGGLDDRSKTQLEKTATLLDQRKTGLQSSGTGQRRTILRIIIDGITRWLAHIRLLMLSPTITRLIKEAPGRTLVLLSLGAALVRGLVWHAWGIARRSLDILDDHDLRQFLRDNGASEAAVNSPLVAALYDGIFAIEGGEIRGFGDNSQERLAAGAGIRCFLRLLLSYKEAMYWKMNAGMGDTIFTPIHDVLRARGVKIEFFHVVRKLELASDRTKVARVRIGRQLRSNLAYDPFIEVKGLRCWPSNPIWNLLDPEDAARIQNGDIDLEDPRSAWPDQSELVLYSRGDAPPDAHPDQIFDRVVLGISIGGLPAIAGELSAANPRFRAMLEKVKTVRTGAYQVWLKEDLAGLGWNAKSPVLSNFVDPLNTWADMTHLLPMESLPHDSEIRNVSYFCGTVPESIPESTGPAHVAARAREVMDAMSASFWRKTQDASGKFNSALISMSYVRCNTRPSDSYVLTVPGSTAYRLYPHESGLSNLTFTGDWTRNHLNVGCVEATVMSGMLASHAISGFPARADIVFSNGP